MVVVVSYLESLEIVCVCAYRQTDISRKKLDFLKNVTHYVF